MATETPNAVPSSPVVGGSAIASATSSGGAASSASCHQCKVAIANEPFIRVGNYQFHKQHFTCTTCSKSLSGQKFHVKDEKFYCHDDYIDTFCHTCSKCSKKIVSGSVVAAFEQYFHPECFVCTECGRSFSKGKYFEHQGRPYCEEHVLDLKADKCAKCFKSVKEADLVRVQGKVYHSECLRCFHCDLLLARHESLFQKDGNVYCQADFLNFFTRRCTACGQHIVKSCVSVNDEFYHPECLKCSVCEARLESYICVAGALRCQAHTEDSFLLFECDVCGSPIATGYVMMANGKRTHEDCFVCFFCGCKLEKVSAKLKDNNLCCAPCLMGPELAAMVEPSSSPSYFNQPSSDSISSGNNAPVRATHKTRQSTASSVGSAREIWRGAGGDDLDDDDEHSPSAPLRQAPRTPSSANRTPASPPQPQHHSRISTQPVSSGSANSSSNPALRKSFTNPNSPSHAASSSGHSMQRARPPALQPQFPSRVSDIYAPGGPPRSPLEPFQEVGEGTSSSDEEEDLAHHLHMSTDANPSRRFPSVQITDSDNHAKPLSQSQAASLSKSTRSQPNSGNDPDTPGAPSSARGGFEKDKSSPGSGRHQLSKSWGSPPISNSLLDDSKRIEWTRGALIGSGSFGKVYQAMNKQTGQLMAVKVVQFSDEESEQARAIMSEISLMQNLRHDNIVTFLGMERQGKKLNILMEYVAGNSLDQLLQRFGPFSEGIIRTYTRQMLGALAFCHSNHVVHRDIKGKNILVDASGQVKLADFGSAKRFADAMSKDAPSLNYNYTPLWTAPEVLTGNYNSKVDIWSLGCVIIEMATAKQPWAEENFENPFRALYHIGNSKAIPHIPDHLSPLAKEFLLCCLTRDPDNRPDAVTLLRHQWITEFDAASTFSPPISPRSPSAAANPGPDPSSRRAPSTDKSNPRRSSLEPPSPRQAPGSSPPQQPQHPPPRASHPKNLSTSSVVSVGSRPSHSPNSSIGSVASFGNLFSPVHRSTTSPVASARPPSAGSTSGGSVSLPPSATSVNTVGRVLASTHAKSASNVLNVATAAPSPQGNKGLVAQRLAQFQVNLSPQSASGSSSGGAGGGGGGGAQHSRNNRSEVILPSQSMLRPASSRSPMIGLGSRGSFNGDNNYIPLSSAHLRTHPEVDERDSFYDPQYAQPHDEHSVDADDAHDSMQPGQTINDSFSPGQNGYPERPQSSPSPTVEQSEAGPGGEHFEEEHYQDFAS